MLSSTNLNIFVELKSSEWQLKETSKYTKQPKFHWVAYERNVYKNWLVKLNLSLCMIIGYIWKAGLIFWFDFVYCRINTLLVISATQM